MPPARLVRKTETAYRTAGIRIGDFKANCRRLLPPDHALNRILRSLPNEISVEVFDASVNGWLALLEVV